MYKKKIWIMPLVLFVIAATIFAQDMQSEKMQQPGMMSRGMSQMQSQGMLCKANNLIGSEVKSRTSASMNQKSMQNIGKVEELIIDKNQDKINYVIVKSDNQNHPVPWWAFDVSPGRRSSMTTSTMDTNDANSTKDKSSSVQTGSEKKATLYLNMTKEDLQQSPTISTVSTDSLSDSTLRQSIDTFFSQHEPAKYRMHQMMGGRSSMSQQESMTEQKSSTTDTNDANAPAKKMAGTAEMTQGDLFKASDIIGQKVKGTSDADLGSIKDLIIDTRHGQVAYGLIGYGGFLDIGEKFAAVPFSSLTIQTGQNYATINATKEQLAALDVGRDPIAKLSQPEFARKIYDSMGVQPYWEVLGFAPGEMVGTAMAAWGANSTYNQNFDPSKVTTISGTIENVSTFQPETGAALGQMLTIKTEEGETLTIHLGPQMFVKRQGFDFQTGNKVDVTGSKVDINNQSVIMASQITSEGKTLTLRDSQGKPQWQMGQQQQQQNQYRKGNY